ncbi:MAG TPA: DUF2939 domain-containing protein [Caulobacteraceae bacterium]|jgi:hypothetical protein|nr:DUF2939 domain-containing protein [Caulobacteraceae bacterium]
MKRIVFAAAAALSLSACATVARVDAGADIHAFLVSIRDGDQAAFEAHVDREALKTQLRGRVTAEAAADPKAARGVQALDALLGGSLVDAAVDVLLRPEVFRSVAQMHGYSADRPIPGALAIAQFVRPLGDGAVCVVLKKGGDCVLDFNDEAGTWKLTGFVGPMSMLQGKR